MSSIFGELPDLKSGLMVNKFSFSATGDLEKIRQSYELFASVFPLAPEHWLKWLRLELNIAISPAEVKRVFLLFQRALSDYYCKSDIDSA